MESRQAAAERIFHEALELAEPGRAAFVERACGGDHSLRAEVEALLTADRRAELSPTLAATLAAPAALLPAAEQAGSQIGRYKLLQLLGEGGFGSVWMAEQREPVKRRVALKIIKLGMDTRQVIARFEAERQALAMMDHPNIARVFDAGATESGRPYFVMEYIRGVPIIEYCDTERLDTIARLRLFVNVCNAIQHAHQKGLIHRDIKPGNVLVTMHDGTAVPKVIDFGIAKATSAELTQRTLFTEHRQLIGTPAYMSPEQAEMSGLDIDTRSDIYSLGVLLYELLTGTTPFDAHTLADAGFTEMLRMIREVDPPTPSTRLSTLGRSAERTAHLRAADVRRLGAMMRGDLDWIVMKCLEKDRTRRYDSAAALGADVQRHLADEPVLAGPPGAGYRVRKFIRRHRVQVATAGLLAGALVLGVVGTGIGLFRARERNQVVTVQRDTAAAALARVAQEARSRAAAGGEDPPAPPDLSGDEAQPVQALADATVRLIGRLDELRQAEIEQGAAAQKAAEEAEQSRQKAEAARVRADKVATLLREILASADPAADGVQVTLISVLRRSDALLVARLQGQPEVELDLRETIGRTFANLGAHADALPHQQRAMALAARVAPPPGGDAEQEARFEWLQRWMNPVFKSCVAMGDAGRMMSIADATASELATDRGEKDPTVELLRTGAAALGPAIAMSKGALNPPAERPSVRRAATRTDRARERMAEMRDLHGDSDLRTIDAIFELAAMLKTPSETEEAASLYTAALAAEAKLREAEDPARQRHQLQHAIFMASRREPEEAILLLQSAVQESERIAGPGRVEVIEALQTIAGYQARLPDPEGQLKTLRSAMSIASSKLGAAHPTTVLLCLELMPALSLAGENAEAERLLRECEAALDQAGGGSHLLLTAVRGGLAHLLAAQGRHAEVVSLLRPVVAQLTSAPGFAPAQSYDPRARLVQSLIELRQWDEAAKELEWFAAEPDAQSTLPDSIRRHGARLWARLFERRAEAQPGEGYEAQAARWRALAQPTRKRDEGK